MSHDDRENEPYRKHPEGARRDLLAPSQRSPPADFEASLLHSAYFAASLLAIDAIANVRHRRVPSLSLPTRRRGSTFGLQATHAALRQYAASTLAQR